MMRPNKFLFTACCLLWMLILPVVAALASEYHLIKRIPVPGDYGWDYMAVESESRRLFVSHDREVVVLDVDSYAILGKIPDTRGVHGIAIASELGRGFISNGQPGTVTIFDLKTLAKIDEVKVGENPNCILFDRHTQRVFTADRGSQRVTAMDAKTGKVIGMIDGLGGKTEYMVADGSGHIFLNMQDRNTVRKIDSQTLKVMETWPLAPCDQATSIDMDRTNQRLFIGCRSSLMVVVDATTGRIVSSHPIGDHVDATAFDAKRALLYFSNGDGSLSVFHEGSADQYKLLENVKTRFGARTMALDPKTGRVFLSVGDLGPPPAPTPENSQPRPPVLPGTFSVLVVGK